MDSLLDFSSKVVLITGAARGLGKGLAEALAERGAKLVIGDVDEAGVRDVAGALTEKGAEVVALGCDVSVNAQCKAMVDAAVETFGQLDIAVNNAGVAHPLMPLHDIEESLMDSQFNVNVKGVQFGMRHQTKQMLKQQSGVILNVSSVAGITGAAYLSAYGAAKHAVIGLTRAGAAEYARHNIRVNAVCPFFTLTRMVTDMSDSEEQKSMSRRTPMGRLAQPEEIVSMMLMLLSPANTFMTGQSIAIDGGVSAV